VIDITEILAHWYAGRSQHDVAGSLGVDRKTIRRYVDPAIAAGFVPGGAPISQADWAPLVKQWFPHLTDTRLRQVTWPDFDKHREYVVELRERPHGGAADVVVGGMEFAQRFGPVEYAGHAAAGEDL